MAKGSPSLVALLGLLAVAGYQNRDKLRDLIQERPSSDPYGDPRETSSQGGLMDTLRTLAGGAGTSGMMGGLGELFDRFAKPHQQAKMQSWVQQGPNAALSPVELEEALDEDTIAELTAKTGLSRDELLHRLSATLPDAVDQVTPDGQFPPISMTEPRSI
jgi:uncharacterized protein YidB (DUF937 family)